MALVAGVAAISVLAGGLMYFRASGSSAGAAIEHASTQIARVPAGVTAAKRAAVAKGSPVELESLRSSISRAEVLPDGKFRVTTAQLPARVSMGSGTWKDADLRLIRRGGEVVPASATPEVAFSGGGDGVRVVARARDRVSNHDVVLTWAGSLPVPTIHGSRAMYASIRPGVDLVLESTRQGFEQYLVVHSRKAAATLKSLPLALSVGGVTVKRGPRGTYALVDAGGARSGEIGAALAWDSSKTGASRTARFAQTLVDGRLSLVPNAGFLNSSSTVYPVTIDPTVALSGGGTEDSSVSSAVPGSNTAGSTVLRVGSATGSPLDAWRAYLSFSTGSPLPGGSSVASAELQLWQSSSSTCTPRPLTVSGVAATPQPGASSVTWQNQPGAGLAVTVSAAHGASSACPAGPVAVDVTDQVQAVVDAQSALATFSVRTDESVASDYAEFASGSSDHPPVLIVTYNSAPVTIGDLQIASANVVDGHLQAGTLPRFEGTGADWDGDQYTLDVQVHSSTTASSSSLVSSCTSALTSSEQQAGCDVASPLSSG